MPRHIFHITTWCSCGAPLFLGPKIHLTRTLTVLSWYASLALHMPSLRMHEQLGGSTAPASQCTSFAILTMGTAQLFGWGLVLDHVKGVVLATGATLPEVVSCAKHGSQVNGGLERVKKISFLAPRRLAPIIDRYSATASAAQRRRHCASFRAIPRQAP